MCVWFWLWPTSPCRLGMPQPVGPAASVGSIAPPGTAQFLQLHCPKQTSGRSSGRYLLNHSCSGGTRNSESIPDTQQAGDSPTSHGGDSPGDRTPGLQPSSQKYVSFPSSPTKERSLVTSWAEDKQVQVLSTVPCLGGTSVCASDRRSGIWFSTKYSGGLAQGVAGKEMRNRANTCLKHISSALSHMHFCFFFLPASPSPLIKLQLCWKLRDVSEKESKVTLSSFVQGLCLFSIAGTGFGRNIHEKPQYKPTITGLTTSEWFNTWQSQMAGSEEVLYCVLNNLKPLTVAISNLLS